MFDLDDLANYHVIELIGQGSFARVYRGKEKVRQKLLLEY